MNPVSFGILTALLSISSSVQGGSLVHHFLGKAIHLSPNDTADLTQSRLEILTRGFWGSVIQNNSPNLSCNDSSGLFPVPGSSTEFYLCSRKGFQRKNGPIFTYSCPDGMTFKAETGICVLLSFALKNANDKKVVNALAQEASEKDLPIVGPPKGASISLKQRRSVKFTGISTLDCQEEANKIVMETNMIYTQISHIDNYIDHLEAIDPLELPNLQQWGKYLKVLKDYNMDLQNAKNNGKMWRTENGVFEAMKEALLLAKNFEPKFDSRFEVFLKSVGMIFDNKGKVKSNSEIMLMDTKAKITELRALLSSNPDQLILLDHFEDELKEVQKAYEDFSIKHEIPKILRFLEFVENDINEIKLKVEETENKTVSFEEKTREDYGKFQRHLNVIKITTDLLKEDKIENERIKETFKREKKSLAERRESLKRNLASVLQKEIGAERKLDKLHQQRSKRNVASVLQKKMETESKITGLHQQRSKRSPLPLSVPIFGGGLIVGWVLKKFIGGDFTRALQMEISSYKMQIAYLESHIKSIEQNITDYDQHLHEYLMKTESFQDEVLQLTELQGSLKFMENQLKYIFNSLTKAKKGILMVKEIFQDISTYLIKLIDEAMESKSAIEQREFLYFIYNEIGTMKCLWDEVSTRSSMFR